MFSRVCGFRQKEVNTSRMNNLTKVNRPARRIGIQEGGEEEGPGEDGAKLVLDRD